MADDELDDTEDTDDTDDTSDNDEQGANPAGQRVAPPIPENEQTSQQPVDPGYFPLISKILAFASEKFGLAKQALSESAKESALAQQGIPTGEPPAELSPEAKQHIDSGIQTENTLLNTPATASTEQPNTKDPIREGRAAASATTLAAVTHAVDPTGKIPPPMSVGESIKYAATRGGMDAGLGILQAHRRNYDVGKSFADVALDHDNIISSIDAANRAYKSVPGLNSIAFAQGRNNTVTATVTDPNGRTDSYALPLNRFQQLLKSKYGDYGYLLNNGNDAGIKELGFKLEPPAPPKMPVVIRPEREDDRTNKRDFEQKKELEEIKGRNAVARENAKTEGYTKTRGIQAQAQIEAARIRAAAGAKPAGLQKLLTDTLGKERGAYSEDEEKAITNHYYRIHPEEKPEEAQQPQQQSAPQKPKLPIDPTTGKVPMVDKDGKFHWVPYDEAMKLLGQ